MPSYEKFSPLLGDMEITHFMEHYWQKKPCILRQVLSDEQCQLFSVDELAGFALDEVIESRLVLGKPGEQDFNKIEVSHGPFSEETLSRLPEQDWTLLLQSVDIWEEKFQSFLSWVNFIPRWRLDDIMVSIAAPGGGVGPHRDQYDVFLIHSEGERRWKVAPPSSAPDDYAIEALVQVAPFKAEIDEVFKAGDVLYLPPGWLHWGVANSLAVTCSIGFRAPSAKDLLIAVTDQLVEQQNDSERYADQWRSPSSRMDISKADIEEVRNKLTGLLANDSLLAEALGKQVTQSKLTSEELSDEVDQDLQFKLENNLKIQLHPASRMSFFIVKGNLLQIYLNGESYQLEVTTLNQTLLEQICLHKPINSSQIDTTTSTEDEFSKFLRTQLVEGSFCIL